MSSRAAKGDDDDIQPRRSSCTSMMSMLPETLRAAQGYGGAGAAPLSLPYVSMVLRQQDQQLVMLNAGSSSSSSYEVVGNTAMQQQEQMSLGSPGQFQHEQEEEEVDDDDDDDYSGEDPATSQ